MAAQLNLPLAATPPLASGTTFINGRCVLRAEGEQRVVFVVGLPVQHYSANDAVAEAYVMVFLVDAGYATQVEVAHAFNCSSRTLRRNVQRYHNGGMTALATRSGWRPGRRRIPMRRARVIERLNAEGLNNCEIARRLGVTENAIRKQVGRCEQSGAQQVLPLPNTTATVSPTAAKPPQAAPAPQPVVPAADAGQATMAVATAPEQTEDPPAAMSLDVDPSNRVWDRLLACFGLLDDAMPIFGDACGVPGAGVLCAVPFLIASGIFRIAYKLYGEIGPAFYGTRTTLMTLLIMAVGRIKRPEALKEHDPQILGRLLGLDRAPEVKTLRKKLTRRTTGSMTKQATRCSW